MWAIAGLLTVTGGFVSHWKEARVVGLSALAITVARVFMHDLSDLDPLPRVISFGLLGALLLLIAYGYNHYKDRLEKYLED